MNLQEYYSKLQQDALSLVYFGNFNDSITEKIIELSESFLEKKNLDKLKRKAVFLVAECFQNVSRHGVQKIQFHGKLEYINAFILRIRGGDCFIASANSVLNENTSFLKNRLEYLNQMDQVELYKLYRAVLEEGKFSSRGGASLGLIEMARKTGNKISFHFEPIGKKYSIFYLMLKFGQESENFASSGTETDHFQDVKAMYKDLLLSRQYLLYKSDFSQESILPVIQMIENNLAKTKNNFFTNKNLYHATVEILQNINQLGARHSDGIKGIFSFGKESSDYLIQSLYETENRQTERLDKLFSELKTHSRDELKLRFRETIKMDNDSISDLVFIDLARISKRWDYRIIRQEGGLPLFNFSLIL